MFGVTDRDHVTAMLREAGKTTLPGLMGLELVERMRLPSQPGPHQRSMYPAEIMKFPTFTPR